MCECLMLAEAEFEPVTIREETLKFVYTDKYGVERVLIPSFAMKIKATKASVVESRDADGKPNCYTFCVW